MDEAFDLMWRTVTRPVFQSRTRREQERLSALRPQIEEIKRVHADDRQVQQRALMDLYRSNDVKPFRACSPNLLPSLLWSVLTGVLSWRGRTIRDRVTRTVVVVEAGGR
jgi:membrane protein insertase Oxa1/YidC/SpoIIIJ